MMVSPTSCYVCHQTAEMGQVGKLQVCGRCKTVHYCSKQCQEKHWPTHQVVCEQFSKTAEFLNRATSRLPGARVFLRQEKHMLLVYNHPDQRNLEKTVRLIRQAQQCAVDPELGRLQGELATAIETGDAAESIRIQQCIRRNHLNKVRARLATLPYGTMESEKRKLEEMQQRLDREGDQTSNLRQDMWTLNKIGLAFMTFNSPPTDTQE